MKHTKQAPIIVAIAAALILVMAGCGSENASSSDHSAQDVAFVNGMIPHHGQAVEMARLATTRALSTEVKDLARNIEAAQQPEIDTMNGWLRGWGEAEVNPATIAGHSKHGASGMMSADEMTAMQVMSGAQFDRAFLEGMIKHHEGAIAMAKTQQKKGKFEPAKEMAASIITSQQAELAQMKQLLL